mmetsp:Transcript_5781/g.13606  ORF Transcript_5781/g.13606 Transcript_5781/m.13606 type:complete len:129 (+) Transcript_5781:1625-2011(+)
MHCTLAPLTPYVRVPTLHGSHFAHHTQSCCLVAMLRGKGRKIGFLFGHITKQSKKQEETAWVSTILLLSTFAQLYVAWLLELHDPPFSTFFFEFRTHIFLLFFSCRSVHLLLPRLAFFLSLYLLTLVV